MKTRDTNIYTNNFGGYVGQWMRWKMSWGSRRGLFAAGRTRHACEGGQRAPRHMVPWHCRQPIASLRKISESAKLQHQCLHGAPLPMRYAARSGGQKCANASTSASRPLRSECPAPSPCARSLSARLVARTPASSRELAWRAIAVGDRRRCRRRRESLHAGCYKFGMTFAIGDKVM